MSGADGSTIVPVDVVQGIVQQLATVSQHTSSATTTTTMAEALADATGRSGGPGVIEGGE